MGFFQWPLPTAFERRRLFRWASLTAVSLVLVLVLDHLAVHLAAEDALDEVERQGKEAAALQAAVLRSELEKYRSLPFVLAQDPDVRTAAQTSNPRELASLNVKLEALRVSTRAAVIYLLDSKGLAIAASNWRESVSFLGNNYAFRPYYGLAVASGAAEYFALGSISGRPGLYLSRRIDGESGVVGVIVVKVEFEEIEQDWKRFEAPTLITDERNIVLVTNISHWRFGSIPPIDPETLAAVRESQQFGEAALDPLPIVSDPSIGRLSAVRASLPEHDGERLEADTFLSIIVPVPRSGWTLRLLAPTKDAVDRATTAIRSKTLLATLSVTGLCALLLHRRDRAQARHSMEAAARVDLEARVEARSVELRQANAQLVAEMDERSRAENALRVLQDELVQASKLAMVGQIATSVAHEVNQPVATIRTYADNSVVHLARGDLASARRNLATIASLTERIGAITSELRTFGRTSAQRVEPVALREAVDGALLLVGHRIRQQAVELAVDMEPDEIKVMAERVRLEQVLVNLLQNALDALADRQAGIISLRAEPSGKYVRVSLLDNGSGIPPHIMSAMFTPFLTTKSEGLGLGLVISHDIIVGFGGELSAADGLEGGACFTIILQRAF
jgi:two-component system C4-dicarboxylate transport sensor histidine kinase DctB